MKTSFSFRRIALAALVLGTAGVTASFADTTTTPTTPTSTTTAPVDGTGWKHHHHSVLTADESAQLKKAHEAALAANPSLQTQKDSLKQQFEALKAKGSAATDADWAALRAAHQDLHTKMRAAELNADPTLAPVFAKLDAAPHKHGHHSAT